MRFQSLDPPITLATGLEVLDLLRGLVLGDPIRVLEALELLPVALDAVPIHGVT
jgi:hypothetical protein